MSKEKTKKIGGVTIFVGNSRGGREPLRDLTAKDVDPSKRTVDTRTARSKSHRDAYSLIFAASGDAPIKAFGDPVVTRSFIKDNLLHYETATNEITRGPGLPLLYSSGPKHFGKTGTTYQAICEGQIEQPNSDSLLEDIRDIEKAHAKETTRKALINARRGQGNFRNQVSSFWNGACAVTGIKIPELLRASHIKAWRDADDRERLDKNNGLFLSANHDALFDKHLISFSDEGEMLASSSWPMAVSTKLNLVGVRLRMPMPPEMKDYMREHRLIFEEMGE